MEAKVDDREIDRLEIIRRYGYHRQDDPDEDEYFALPCSRDHLLQDWTTWRAYTNTGLLNKFLRSDGSDREVSEILTSPPETKAPRFFTGKGAVLGMRAKDHYGAAAITESDDDAVRTEKEIIDENFFLFGIPRVSLKRCRSARSDSAPRPHMWLDGSAHIPGSQTINEESDPAKGLNAILEESIHTTEGYDRVQPSKYKNLGNRLPRTMFDKDERGEQECTGRLRGT